MHFKCTLVPSVNWPTVILIQEHDGMHWQKKNGRLQGRKMALIPEVWPFGLTFFFHFHQWGLHSFLQRKSKNRRTYNMGKSQDSGFLEDLFAVCPEAIALDTANLVTFFFSEVWQKCTKFILVQPGPHTQTE